MAEAVSSITGLSSGIDSKALIEQIISMERRSAVRLEAQVSANTKRTEALGQFQSALDALKTATEGLRAGTAFDAYSVTVAGTGTNGRALFAASGGPGAVPGTYQVKVLGLATAQKTTASVGQASATADLGLTGTFELRRPADPADPAASPTVLGAIDVAGKSLTQIRDAVNAFSGTSKIQASIVSAKADGSDQRLVLSSTQTGQAGAFELAATAGDPLTPLGLAAPLQQNAADARLEVDGITITRPTNTVTDVLPGVTLTLSSADVNASASLTVERLNSTPREAMKVFVEAYNKVQAFIKTQSAAGATLAKEPMLRTVRGALSGVVLAPGTGLPTDLATLNSVGVSLTKEGTLQFDAAKFDAAAGSRFDELKATLASRMGAVGTYIGTLTSPTTGAIDQREVALSDQSARFTSRIDSIDSRLDKKRAGLLAQFAKFESSLGRINAIGSQVSAQLAGLARKSDD